MGGSTFPANPPLSTPTAVDLDMLDTNLIENRSPLPTSLSDFALIPSSSASAPSSPSAASSLDDSINPFFRRLRRSSLLASSPITSHLHPEGKLASSFSASSPLRAKRSLFSINSETVNTDTNTASSSSSSPASSSAAAASQTVSKLLSFDFNDQTPSTSKSADFRFGPSLTLSLPETPTSRLVRRASIPLKPPRLIDIKTELKSPIESELKSEAQFQRLVASYSNAGFPINRNVPRTPRSWLDRGRYPEEAVVGDDDLNNDYESGSDDDENTTAPGSVHSVSVTPSGSGASISGGSGEDQPMTLDTSFTSGFMMDIDMVRKSLFNRFSLTHSLYSNRYQQLARLHNGVKLLPLHLVARINVNVSISFLSSVM